MRRAAVLALSLVLAAPSARADRASDAAAVRLYEQSAQAYNAGDFARAVTLLQQAYRHRADPVLVYNLARAYEGLGDLPHAVASYEEYVGLAPDADDVGAVRARIATLKKQIAAVAPKLPPAPSPPRAAAERPPQPARSASAGPWIVLGTGAAAGIAGAVLGVLAASRHDAALSASSQSAAASDQSAARGFATAANVAWIVGGVLVVGGVVWAIVK